MRLTGAGPEGIDPGNELGHPARGPVGRKARGSLFRERENQGQRALLGELSRRLATRGGEAGWM